MKMKYYSYQYIIILLVLIWGISASNADYFNNNETEECDPGKWGENCTEDCDPNCDVNKTNCNKETGACPYCIDTYYTSPEDPKICLKCNIECKDKCNAVDGCLECKTEKHYGKWCEDICSNCLISSGKYCDKEGLCYGECAQGFFTHYCNEKCPQFCLLEEDENCNIDTGECVHCQKGYYPTSCEKCNEICSECVNDSECTVCKNITKYGKTCNNTCNINCFSVENQTTPICDIYTGKCNSCKDGFYSEFCDLQCEEGCKKCLQDSGYCELCDYNYILIGGTCVKCPSGCDGCLSLLYCEDCKNGTKYGDLCTLDCPEHCYYDENKTTEIDNYNLNNDLMGDLSDFTNRKCNRTTGDCFKCEDNFEGNKCEYCILGKFGTNCSINCNEGCDLTKENCLKETGACICKKGYYELDCNKKCQVGCLDCEKLTGYCKECDIDYYNDEGYCVKCADNCAKGYGCSKEKCNACMDGFYGNLCNKNCPKLCLNTSCYQDTGLCVYGCQDHVIGEFCDHCEFNYTGLSCEKKCEFGCNLTEGVDNCDMETGFCSCKTGFYTSNCSLSCPENCNFTKGNCDVEEGTCKSCNHGFYTDYCNSTCLDKNCYVCSKDLGICTECKAEYFMRDDNSCEECPDSCYRKECVKSGCYYCNDYTTYGIFCNESCSNTCSDYYKEYDSVCDRDTGSCLYGCKTPHLIPPDKCDKCDVGYFGEFCEIECGTGCLTTCDRETGLCEKCILGYYGETCNGTCPEHCNTTAMNCDKISGICYICNKRYFGDDCQECPVNCNDCDDLENCTSCRSGFYGDNCSNNCSINCDGKECDQKTGFCNNCLAGFYSDFCNKTCEGCYSKCFQGSGLCTDGFCKEGYYDPLNRCSKKCSDKCLNKDCDFFTGDCIQCPPGYYGKECDNLCSPLCEDDNRLECCYAKSEIQPKSFSIKLFNNSYIYIKLGSESEELLALVDFESNSQLVVFDLAHNYSEDRLKINIIPKYNSSKSTTYMPEEYSDYTESSHDFMQVHGFQASDYIQIDTTKNDTKKFKIKFLVAKDLKVLRKITIHKQINAVIGLGFLSLFNENLLRERVIDRNLIYYSNFYSFIQFGDYPNIVKTNFDKFTTISNFNTIFYNKEFEVKAKMQGITYSLRKAYKLDKEILISFSRNTVFAIPDSIFKIFFTKIYFGSTFNKGCYIKEKRRGVQEFYCEKEKYESTKFSSLGVIIDNYTYEFSQKLLFKQQNDEYKFLIELRDTTEVILGLDFFNEYDIMFNNGNYTFNVYGKTKKFNFGFESMDDWVVIDEDEILTPGKWALIAIFGILFLVMVGILNNRCFSAKKDLEDYEVEILR